MKLIKELRGGDWGPLAAAAFLGIMILIFSLGDSFVPNNPDSGWGLDRQNPFQPPASKHKYPPYYNPLYPDPPGGSRIMDYKNSQSSPKQFSPKQ